MKYKVSSTLPYPDIEVEGKNLLYGEILLQDLAGQISEETSIHEYLYQSVVVPSDPSLEIADTLEKLAKVEMHHLQILTKLIYKLGVDPKFRTLECFLEHPIYWKGQYVPYEKDITKILELNIKQEQDVIEQYLNHVQVIQDRHVQQILNRIILDEKIHIETLKKLQNLLKS